MNEETVLVYHMNRFLLKRRSLLKATSKGIVKLYKVNREQQSQITKLANKVQKLKEWIAQQNSCQNRGKILTKPSPYFIVY